MIQTFYFITTAMHLKCDLAMWKIFILTAMQIKRVGVCERDVNMDRIYSH